MPRLSALIVLAVLLAACDAPRDREPKINPPPSPLAAGDVPPPARSAASAVPRPSVFAWDEASGSFTGDGQKLQAGRLWTFEGSTHGFVLAGGQVAPAEPAGLAVALRVFDPILRTPSGLDLDGSRYSLVLVRLTRVAAGSVWDGTLFYATDAHPESGDYMAVPLDRTPPVLNETVILAYDLRRPYKGGDDWITSRIDQLRLDLDDQPGGEFLIHQVAIVEPPSATPPPALRPAP